MTCKTVLVNTFGGAYTFVIEQRPGVALAVPGSRVVCPSTGVAECNGSWWKPRKTDTLQGLEELICTSGVSPFLRGVLQYQYDVAVVSRLHGCINFFPNI